MGPTKNSAFSSFPLYSIKRKNSGLFNSSEIKYTRLSRFRQKAELESPYHAVYTSQRVNSPTSTENQRM
ncbi:Uncharacterized protein FWK35_00029788 [Aphis craccivora]|uniref:Uncharacterized protein n=1 Tax=Aphis craccivora TaxID=307492 RepID=A0A6G0YQP1_APHCR|nr:Uncharacterized protein FWK35_00029788 [Aphis craccivora]